MKEASALYRGRVMHRRLRPKAHKLGYRVFWLLLDLDEIDDLAGRLRLFSRNRFNLLSFHDCDYGDGSGASLRMQIEALLEKAGVDLSGGTIRLLTMPRVLGYVFNPISLYYACGPDGRLRAMVYEVTSTFGVRHAYVIPVPPEDQGAGRIRQGAAKALYVSPFMDMAMDYRFRGRLPAERLKMVIGGFDAEGLLITATMTGERRALTDRRLLATTLTVPLLTLKVTAAIHWEALKLWVKRVPLTRQPPSAREPFTIQQDALESRLEG